MPQGYENENSCNWDQVLSPESPGSCTRRILLPVATVVVVLSV